MSTMYANAGIRSPFGSSTPTRQSSSKSESSQPWNSSSSASAGHKARQSDSSAGHSYTSSFSSGRVLGLVTVSSRSISRASAYPPPSSFSPFPSQFPSLSRPSQHGLASGSIVSLSSLQSHNTNTPGPSASTASTPRPSMEGHFQQSSISISRCSSISQRNGSLNSTTHPPVNGENLATALSIQQQRSLNMKRLLSKPTDVAPGRSRSVLSFSAAPLPSDGDTDSVDDYLAIKSRSLDILRKSRRRSRSVDILADRGKERSRLSASPTTSRKNVGIGYDRSPTQYSVSRLSAPVSPSFHPDDRPISTAPITQYDPNRSSYHQEQIATPTSEYTLTPCSPPEPPMTTTKPIFPMTPASAIALAWSQRHATTSSNPAENVSSNSISIPSTPAGLPSIQAEETQRSHTPVLSPNASPNGVLRSPSPVRRNSRPSSVVVTERNEYPYLEDDSFRTWMLADNTFVPATTEHDTSAPSSGVGGSGVGATMRELSRKVTGAFGRREKHREKREGPSQSQSYKTVSSPPSSFPVGKLRYAGSPLPTPAKSVTKAPQGPPLASLSSQALPSVTSHEHSGSFPRTLKTEQLASASTSVPLAHAHNDPSDSSNGGETTSTPMPPWGSHSPVWNGGDSSKMAASPTTPFPPITPFPMTDQDVRRTVSQTSIPKPAPVRSHTPNTLKKRSKGSLRPKASFPVISAPIPIITGGETVSTPASHGNPSPISDFATAPTSSANPPIGPEDINTGPAASSNGGGGKLLRGLVRKLSSGALRRSPSQNRSQLQHGAFGGNGKGDTSPESSTHGHSAGDLVPPVPPLPKDFELVDTAAYLAERAKRMEEDAGSDEGSSGVHGARTPQVFPSSSQRSSRRSSPIPSLPHRGTEPSLPTTASETPVRPPKRGYTDPPALTSNTIPTASRNVPVPSNAMGTYVFPRRPKPMQELSSSQGSTSQSWSGTDHGHLGAGYRSSPPSPSSSDVHYAIKTSGGHEDHAMPIPIHETAPSRAQLLIGQPIIPPKELYQRGENEAATLRNRQQVNGGPDNTQRQRTTPAEMHPLRTGKEIDDIRDCPPPIISPELLPALSAPPPRPARRREVKGKSPNPIVSTVSQQPSPSTSRPKHAGHQRSLSSPISPGLPTFDTNNAVNATPLSKRSQSVGAGSRVPRSITDVILQDTEPTVVRSKSRSSVKTTASHRAKTLPPLALTPNSARTAEGDASVVSPERDGDSVSLNDSNSRRKLRLHTSLGTITRVRSLLGSKSPSTGPNTASSYSAFSPPSSGGRRSLSGRVSQERSRQAFMSPQEELPPVPFTSTAFTFKGISSASPSAKVLTEGEREDMWNELLVKSDLAGGTLTVSVDQKEGLLSDKASFILES
ncbi:hypothetical protein FRC14_002443 [Serendipita sp. 396]|nr:hypothetical protein FRC14_002443 [Serendipita sp. 396]KAG8798450.1 hypothetical protein FRC16_007243 [Serendipita sp. 398]